MHSRVECTISGSRAGWRTKRGLSRRAARMLEGRLGPYCLAHATLKPAGRAPRHGNSQFTRSGMTEVALMAQALRIIQLPAEETRENPTLSLRQRRRPAAVGWARLAFFTLFVSLGVGILVSFVNAYARIAQAEMRCQALKQEYAQLNRACIELNLELERLATQPRMAKIAQVQGLALPDADRIHYLQGRQDYPGTRHSPTVPAPEPESWARRSGLQMLAALGTAWQVLGGGATTAYAQD